MPHPRQKTRQKVQTAQRDAELQALKTENLRLRNALLAPRAAAARLEAARTDALAVHIDKETLDRIERMRADVISRRIRDRVMKPDKRSASPT